MNYELRGDYNTCLTCGAKLIASITPEQWVAPALRLLRWCRSHVFD